MRDLHDQDGPGSIVDLIDDAIIADAKPQIARPCDNRTDAARPRIGGKRVDRSLDSLSDGGREAIERSAGRTKPFDLVRHPTKSNA
jgi:hypothetical protein